MRSVYNYLNKLEEQVGKSDNYKKENIISISTKTENNYNIKTTSEKPTKKIGDKWYALLYLIEVEVYKKQIPTSADGTFIRTELEEIGKDRCENSGQGFYRNVRDLKDVFKDKNKLKKVLNDDWITVIIELSKNDKKIINYLKKNYK